MSQWTFGIAPALTPHVATKAKETMDIEKHRSHARELRALQKWPPAGQNGISAAAPGRPRPGARS